MAFLCLTELSLKKYFLPKRASRAFLALSTDMDELLTWFMDEVLTFSAFK